MKKIILNKSYLKRFALALAASAAFLAGNAQAATTTTVIEVGPTPAGTYYPNNALVSKVDQGTLPAGSLLRSVTLDYTLRGGNPYLGDLAPLFADSTGDNGALAIIGQPNDGGWPKSASATVNWNSGGDYAIGTHVSATLTAANGIPTIDLHDYAVWLMECGWDGTFSGSVTNGT